MNDFLRTFKQPKSWAFLGLACTLAWAFLINGAVGGDSSHQAPWNIAYGALAVCMLGFGAAYVKAPAFLNSRQSGLIASVLGAVGFLVLTLSFNLGTLAFLQIPAAILCAAVLGWLYLQWGLFYSNVTLKFAIGCMFAANITGSLIKTIAHFSPLGVSCAIGCLLPVGSWIMCFIALGEDAPNDAPVIHFERQNIRGLWKVALAIAAFSFVTAFLVRRFAVNQNFVDGPDFLLARAFEIAISIIVIVAVYQVKFAFNFPQLWRIILVVLAVDLFFQAAFPGLSIVRCVESSAWDLIVLCAWLTLTDIARHSSLPAPVVIGAGWACYAASFALGSAAAGVFPFGTLNATTNASIMLILLLTSTFALELRDQDTKWIFSELSGAPTTEHANFASIDERCEAVGAARGLTAREIEVMQMLCKGRTKAYIAETLYLSENTVRGHAKHIYTKLDVHSKQELLDLVE